MVLSEVNRFQTRFVESDGILREKMGEHGSLVVTSRNQEIFEGCQKDLQLNEKDFILDTKRKRVEIN